MQERLQYHEYNVSMVHRAACESVVGCDVPWAWGIARRAPWRRLSLLSMPEWECIYGRAVVAVRSGKGSWEVCEKRTFGVAQGVGMMFFGSRRQALCARRREAIVSTPARPHLLFHQHRYQLLQLGSICIAAHHGHSPASWQSPC